MFTTDIQGQQQETTTASNLRKQEPLGIYTTAEERALGQTAIHLPAVAFMHEKLLLQAELCGEANPADRDVSSCVYSPIQERGDDFKLGMLSHRLVNS